MKKYIDLVISFRTFGMILSLALLNPASLWSQEEKSGWEEFELRGRVQSFCETSYFYDGAIKSLRSVSFDRLGRKIEEAQYEIHERDNLGKMWKRKSFTFDPKGRLVREAVYVGGKVIELNSKKFNALDQLIEEYKIPDYSMRDGVAGARSFRTIHRYDTKGNLIESRFMQNDSQTPYAVSTFKYNERRDLTETRTLSGGKTEVMRFTYVYDARDSVIKKVEFRQSEPYRTWLFEYGPEGKLVSKVEYENSSADSLKRPTEINRYDAQGRSVEWILLRRDFFGPSEMTSSRFVYEFDELGREVGSRSYKSGNLSEIMTSRRQGNMLETAYEYADGRMRSLDCRVNAKVVERIEFDKDGAFFRRTGFEYDEYGNQVNEFFWGRDGKKVWQDGKFSLVCDSEGNWVEKINDLPRAHVVNRRDFTYFTD